MYLRFITQFIDEENITRTGLFNALAFIRDHKLTTDEDEARLKILYSWFKENLDAPGWFVKPQGHSHETKSLSWFKDSAKEHILKVYEIVEILERYNLIVEMMTSKESPGYIVFQDEFQISAVPFKAIMKQVI